MLKIALVTFTQDDLPVGTSCRIAGMRPDPRKLIAPCLASRSPQALEPASVSYGYPGASPKQSRRMRAFHRVIAGSLGGYGPREVVSATKSLQYT